MSFLAAAGALAEPFLDAAGVTGWLGYSSAKSLNKATAKQNARISLKTAKKLALNQPSWTVQGLRDAGLNPILAASSFGNASLANVSGSSGSLSNGSIDNPVSTALQVSNLEKQNDNLDRQNDLLSAQKKQAEANTLKSMSEAQLNSAKTNNTTQDTLNKASNRGLSGVFGLSNQIGRDLDNRASRLWSDVKSGFRSVDEFRRERIDKPVIDLIKRVGSRFSNSAKDMRDGASALVAPSPRMRHEMRSSSLSLPKVRRKHN